MGKIGTKTFKIMQLYYQSTNNLNSTGKQLSMVISYFQEIIMQKKKPIRIKMQLFGGKNMEMEMKF